MEPRGVSSSNKRERELARKKAQSQAERRAARVSARRRRQQVIGVVVALSVVVAGVAWFLWSGRTDSNVVASPGASATPSPSGSGAKNCVKAATPTTKTQTWATAPTNKLVAKASYFITLDTNCGKVEIQADAVAAPKTTNSMIFLANQNFYTASDCFRLTTEGLYVLQCGSPTNNGQGGPGYTVPDENLPKAGDANYPAGTVAMANAGAGTAGSQFFLVYKDTTLPPNYTIWGKVISGLDVLNSVAAQGVQGGGADGKPVQPLVITKATTRQTQTVG